MKSAVLLIFCVHAFTFVHSDVIPHHDVKRSNDVLPLETLVHQQAATIQTLQSELTAMKSRFAALESRVDTQEERRQVAFSVRFSGHWSTHHVGNGGTLIFNQAITNTGNGYNTETGFFTVPFSGTYLFIVGAMTRRGYGELALTKTGGRLLALSHNEQHGGVNHDRDTMQAAVHLQAGEQVWVKHNYGTHDYQGYFGTVFTGVLVEAD